MVHHFKYGVWCTILKKKKKKKKEEKKRVNMEDYLTTICWSSTAFDGRDFKRDIGSHLLHFLWILLKVKFVRLYLPYKNKIHKFYNDLFYIKKWLKYCNIFIIFLQFRQIVYLPYKNISTKINIKNRLKYTVFNYSLLTI